MKKRCVLSPPPEQCGTDDGVRKIAARFGVDPSTVQRISRPFDAAA